MNQKWAKKFSEKSSFLKKNYANGDSGGEKKMTLEAHWDVIKSCRIGPKEATCKTFLGGGFFFPATRR